MAPENQKSPIKILLVDDDEVIRIFIRDVFWVHGNESLYEVTVSDNLAEAKNLVTDKKTRPDVVFLDLSMPGKKSDGSTFMNIEGSLDFLSEIKNNPETKDIKVLIFSGYKEPGLKEKLIERGADHYLVKGEYLPKELVEFVASHVSHLN